VSAEDHAMISLRELIALYRIVEEVREVGEELKVGIDPEQLHELRRATADVAIAAGEAVALGDAAVSRVELSEARDETFFDRAQRYMIARIPAVVIGEAEDGELRRRRTDRIAHDAVEFANSLRDLPRAVVRLPFSTDEQIAAAELERAARGESRQGVLSVLRA